MVLPPNHFSLTPERLSRRLPMHVSRLTIHLFPTSRPPILSPRRTAELGNLPRKTRKLTETEASNCSWFEQHTLFCFPCVPCIPWLKIFGAAASRVLRPSFRSSPLVIHAPRRWRDGTPSSWLLLTGHWLLIIHAPRRWRDGTPSSWLLITDHVSRLTSHVSRFTTSQLPILSTSPQLPRHPLDIEHSLLLGVPSRAGFDIGYSAAIKMNCRKTIFL